MTRPSHQTTRARDSRPRRAIAALLIGSPPAVVAAAAVTGIGLSRGASSSLAIFSALCLVLLPVLGLAGLAGRRSGSLVVGAWLWSLLLLAALPRYFPGERSGATDAGLRLLARPLGAAIGEGLGELAARAVAALGSDGAPAREGLPADAGEPSAPRRTGTPNSGGDGHARSRSQAADGETERIILLPYDGDERSLHVSVDIDGPHSGERFDMIFDTGATYTTLSHDVIEQLEIPIPSDTPWVTLRTANGKIRAPLVLVDAIWLGEGVVEWVTVAVCDGCAEPPSAGLLGLNVSREFRVALDHDARRIELRPLRYGTNRQLDISQWLEIRSSAARSRDGSIRVELTGQNRSRRAIESAVVELDCGGRGFAVQLDRIPAHGEAITEIPLPPGTDCRRPSVRLSSGSWLLDRF